MLLKYGSYKCITTIHMIQSLIDSCNQFLFGESWRILSDAWSIEKYASENFHTKLFCGTKCQICKGSMSLWGPT